MSRLLFIFMLILLTGHPVRAEPATDFRTVDRQFAAAVLAGSVSTFGGLPARASDDIALQNRELLVEAMAALEPVRSDPQLLSAKQADLLVSVLSTIESSRVREQAGGSPQDLRSVARAVWQVYVDPLRADSERAGLVGLADPAAPLIRRWFDTGRAGTLTVAELYADDGAATLSWRFTDTRAVTAAGSAIIRHEVATGPSGLRGARYLVLYMEISGLAAKAARRSAAGQPTSDRLRILVEDSEAEEADCLRQAKGLRNTGAGGTKDAEGLRGAVDPAEAGPPAPAGDVKAACRKQAKPLVGVVDRALLLDVARQILIFERPPHGEADVGTAMALARGLAKDWP